MGFYMSPGVYTRERDLSTIVPAISTTVGAIVGYSAKGSLDVSLVTNRQQFIEEFGEPVVGNYFHYSALAFLEHGRQLYCRRVVNGALYGGMHVVTADAVDVNTGFSVGQVTPVFYDDSNISDEIFSILQKDPGVWGNSIDCIIKNVKDGAETEPTEQYTFEIDVYYTDSQGVRSKVENWKVSRRTKLDGFGKQQYIESQINVYSKYITVADNTAISELTLPKANSSGVTFQGGNDGSAVAPSHIIGTSSAGSGWYGFENPEDVDVRMLIGGGFMSGFTDVQLAQIQTAMIAIAESRRDCIAVLDVTYADVATDLLITAYRNVTLNANTSYAALYVPWVKINDVYNDRIVEVPPSGYVTAQYAYNDAVAYPWFAPAGFNRGVLNILGNSRVFSQGSRNTLYAAGINPIQTFRGEGKVIWGQKTLQAKNSALDRVNVRRLLITIEKAMAISLRPFLFEPNNDLTRYRVTGMLDEYLAMISSQGGFQTEVGDGGYQVICDENNNTPAIIDRNELHVDVFVKPIRAAEFIQLQTIITTTGASFEELISRGALL